MACWQDARPPEEYDVGHVAGAIRVAPDGSDAKQTIETLTASNPGTVAFILISLYIDQSSYWPGPLANDHMPDFYSSVCVVVKLKRSWQLNLSHNS